MSLQVASQVDSRTILDTSGAESLLGNGDMLYQAGDTSKLRRVQGAYVSEKEVEDVVKLDQIVKVNVSEIDDMGRLNLSMKLGADADKPSTRPEGAGRPSGGGMRRDDRGPRSFDRAQDKRGGGRSFGGPSSGPRRSFSGGGRRVVKEKQYEGGRRDDWNR